MEKEELLFFDILCYTKESFGNVKDFPHYESCDASGLPIFPADCIITTEEFKKRFAEQERLYPLHKIREKRNKLLAESDWTQMSDVVLANKEEWKTYRQALRDLPSVCVNAAYDVAGNLINVEYPTKP